MNKQILKYAVINSLGVTLYVTLVGLLFNVIQKFFGDKPDTIFAPIFMLMLLVFSAALTGFLMVGKPVMWFLEGKKTEALHLFLYTLGCLFVLVLLVLLIMAIAAGVL